MSARGPDSLINDQRKMRLSIAVKLRRLGRLSILDRRIKEIVGPSEQSELPQLAPLFESLDAEQFAKLIKRARQLDPSYRPVDFAAWRQFECPPNVDPDELAAALRNLADVETAYVMRPGPPPVNPFDDPRHSSQGYLRAAPNGIDAHYAWDFPGGDGSGIGFIDLEQGWNLGHEDLCAARIDLISGVNRDHRRHGTQVLGVILMVDNAVGGVGIAHRARGSVVSQWRSSCTYNTPDAIADVLPRMEFGDVLLLEAQEYDPVGRTYYWPVEIAKATYDIIRLATAGGVVVIEAAGNGNRNLDEYTDHAGNAIFDSAFRDSGAIVVGAASSSLPHMRRPDSNHGSRVDCYSWGENIDTADTDVNGTADATYWGGFNGTSGASAIIAGAALIVQGLAVASWDYRFGCRAVRSILTTDGTPSADPTNDLIGVMPDLRAIIVNDVLQRTRETARDDG